MRIQTNSVQNLLECLPPPRPYILRKHKNFLVNIWRHDVQVRFKVLNIGRSRGVFLVETSQLDVPRYANNSDHVRFPETRPFHASNMNSDNFSRIQYELLQIFLRQTREISMKWPRNKYIFKYTKRATYFNLNIYIFIS